jgi:CheY-like chemotaxis protein
MTALEAAPAPLPSPAAATAAPAVKVLLVDDQAANLAALEAVLSGLDLELVKARSGAEALRHLLRKDFA